MKTLRSRLSELWGALFGGGRLDAEMDEELHFHLELETEKNLRAGMSPAEARRRAMVAFGGVERFREKTREERGVRTMEELLHDGRYALRQLRKDPGFALVVILTLALGIGATTTIFSVVNGILLRPLPFREPERLVQVWPEQTFTKGLFEDFRDEVPFLDGLAAYSHQSFTFSRDGEVDAEELRGASVSSEYFQVLGVPPALGRGFLPEDEAPGAENVVILSHGLWERRFGSDPGIMGRSISVGEGEGARRTVVGVMPEGYRPLYEAWQLWVPFQIDPSNFPDYQGTASLSFLGRVAERVSLEVANARFHEVAARLTSEMTYIPEESRAAAGLTPLREGLLGDVRLRVLILLGSVGLVLLLACINVANLLLVRGQGRGRELGIRLAMGARRGRVIRQLLTESLVLGCIGGGLGLLLAYWSLPALVGILPAGIPRTDLIVLDGPVLAFSMVVSVLSALLFGLLPAFRAAGRDLLTSLKDGGVGQRQAPSGQRLRNGLVAAELALALVVVVGATLLFRSFWHLQHQDPGFDASQVLTLRLNLSSDRYPDGAGRHALYEEIGRRVASMDGVTSVGWTGALPLGGGASGIRYHSDDSSIPREELPTYATVRPVSPGFLSALRIPILRGAYPEGLTGEGEQEVVLVSRALALSLWPDGDDPVGKTVWLPFGSEVPARIAGMTEDFSQLSLDREPGPEILIPWELWTQARMYLVVRASEDPQAMIPQIREAVWSADENIPIDYVRTMEAVVDRTTANSRLTTLLLLVFGAIALVLGAVGVYGVASHAVAQRTFEIGVRMALGARQSLVLREVLLRFAALVATGVGIGLVGAVGAARVLSGVLFEVSSTDLSAYAVAAGLLVLVALLACLVPALRATRVQPAAVLRLE